jgi:hypothetical protein
LARRSAFVALGAALGLAAVAAPAGAQVIPGLPLPPGGPTTTTAPAPAGPDHGHDGEGGHDGHRDHHGDEHRDDHRHDDHRDADAHHDPAPSSPTTTKAPPQHQDRAVLALPAPTSTTTAAHHKPSAHPGTHAVTSAGASVTSRSSTVTSTTRPRHATAPSTAAHLDHVKTVSAQGINASLRHNRSTPLEGQLVSRRVASPLTAGFVALAILVLLLDGGRRRTRGSR